MSMLRPVSRVFLTVALVLACFACGGGASKPQPATSSGGDAPAGEKVDVAALFAREGEPAAMQAIATPDGNVKSKIESPTPATVTVEDGFVMIASTLAEHTLQCFVYPEGKDGSEILRLLTESTLGQAIPDPKNRRWVDVRGDQVNGWPYVIGRANYLFENEGVKMAGDYKVAVSVRENTTVACLMDGAGYYASFERVVRSLLESMDSAPNRDLAAPAYAEITRSGVEGRMVSITRVTYQTNDKGHVQKVSLGMHLALTMDGGLQTSDEASVEGYSKGRLDTGKYVSTALGTMSHEVDLSVKGDNYSVAGKVQDKPITGAFSVKGGIIDEKRSKALICGVLQGKQPKAELVHYVPDLNPTALTTMTVEKSAVAGWQLLASFVGTSVQMKLNVDEDCDIENGSVNVGPMEVPIARIWFTGKVP